MIGFYSRLNFYRVPYYYRNIKNDCYNSQIFLYKNIYKKIFNLLTRLIFAMVDLHTLI